VAGGAVETYPAGLVVVYLAKLSMPQHCLSPMDDQVLALHRKRI
jgi:hypothetical protein